MPAKNRIKSYVANSYYHIYNRGVEKRTIFENKQDIGVFLSYLKEYLLPKDEEKLRLRLADSSTSIKEKDSILKRLRLNNFSNSISLLCYCLMPNHFHLLVKQHTTDAIDLLINSLGTRYTMYFNRKYKRVGPLYQGVYKAVLIGTDEQLLHLSRYIHRNPLSLKGQALQTLSEPPSSYADYLNLRTTGWLQSDEILSNFSTIYPNLTYRSFVEQTDEKQDILNNLIIDEPS